MYFCSPYPLIQQFRRCAAKYEANDLQQGHFGQGCSFLQYAGDNADHNTLTLDGNDTMHVLGQQAVCNPAVIVERVIKRCNVSIEELRQLSSIGIRYVTSCRGLSDVVYRPLRMSTYVDKSAYLDIL